ncbi:hypothetical protein Golax_011888, partial [Gossypium laxum]|nr:hypothetical protein [Gossypium laxum]
MREGRRQSVNDVCTFVLGYVKELVMLEKSYLKTMHDARKYTVGGSSGGLSCDLGYLIYARYGVSP